MWSVITVCCGAMILVLEELKTGRRVSSGFDRVQIVVLVKENTHNLILENAKHGPCLQ